MAAGGEGSIDAGALKAAAAQGVLSATQAAALRENLEAMLLCSDILFELIPIYATVIPRMLYS